MLKIFNMFIFDTFNTFITILVIHDFIKINSFIKYKILSDK